jgi:hypothetical protein
MHWMMRQLATPRIFMTMVKGTTKRIVEYFVMKSFTDIFFRGS